MKMTATYIGVSSKDGPFVSHGVSFPVDVPVTLDTESPDRDGDDILAVMSVVRANPLFKLGEPAKKVEKVKEVEKPAKPKKAAKKKKV